MAGAATSDHSPETSKRPRILLVDDHEPTRTALTILLESAFRGFQVLTAGDAEQALQICETEPAALVIMDIRLPGIDGFEAARRIKAKWPATLVIVHSSSDQQVYRDRSEAVGASGFVSKSRTSKDLLPAIAALLQTGQSSR